MPFLPSTMVRCIILATFLSLVPASAAEPYDGSELVHANRTRAERRLRPEPHVWNHYQGVGLSGGLGGRYGMWGGNANMSWFGRAEYGAFAAGYELLAGVTFNTDPGVWGRASATLNVLTNPRSTSSLILGVGPSFTVVSMPKAEAPTVGLNAQASFGWDFRQHGESYLTLRATVDIPIPQAGSLGRTAPMMVFSIEGPVWGGGATRVTTPQPPTPTPIKPEDNNEVHTTEPPQEPETATIDWQHCEITHQKIFFELDSADLQLESAAVVSEVAALINRTESITVVRVEGHTDEQGDSAYNLGLSNRRVDSVLRALQKDGVAESRLKGVGMGESDPAFAGAVRDEEHARNRRVLFIIEDCEEQDVL